MEVWGENAVRFIEDYRICCVIYQNRCEQKYALLCWNPACSAWGTPVQCGERLWSLRVMLLFLNSFIKFKDMPNRFCELICEIMRLLLKYANISSKTSRVGSGACFESKFYMWFYIQYKKTVFFNTITIHFAIIYQQWVAWINSKRYLNN